MYRETSREAYLAMLPHRAERLRQVYNAIWDLGGASCYDVCRHLRLPHQTVSARINDLMMRKLVVDVGLRSQIQRGDETFEAIRWMIPETVPPAYVPPKVIDKRALLKVCQDFIRDQRITCAEATVEDRVYENAPELVEAIAEIIGYHKDEDS